MHVQSCGEVKLVINSFHTPCIPTGALASRKASPCSGMDQSHQLLVAHIQQLVQVHPAKGELAKSPLLLYRRGLFGILRVGQVMKQKGLGGIESVVTPLNFFI